MTKLCIYPWYQAQSEISAITKAGYPVNQIFETEDDLFQILKKLWLSDVTVVLHKFNGTISDPVYSISVSHKYGLGQC